MSNDSTAGRFPLRFEGQFGLPDRLKDGLELVIVLDELSLKLLDLCCEERTKVLSAGDILEKATALRDKLRLVKP